MQSGGAHAQGRPVPCSRAADPCKTCCFAPSGLVASPAPQRRDASPPTRCDAVRAAVTRVPTGRVRPVSRSPPAGARHVDPSVARADQADQGSGQDNGLEVREQAIPAAVWAEVVDPLRSALTAIADQVAAQSDQMARIADRLDRLEARGSPSPYPPSHSAAPDASVHAAVSAGHNALYQQQGYGHQAQGFHDRAALSTGREGTQPAAVGGLEPLLNVDHLLTSHTSAGAAAIACAPVVPPGLRAYLAAEGAARDLELRRLTNRLELVETNSRAKAKAGAHGLPGYMQSSREESEVPRVRAVLHEPCPGCTPTAGDDVRRCVEGLLPSLTSKLEAALLPRFEHRERLATAARQADAATIAADVQRLSASVSLLERRAIASSVSSVQ